MNTNYFTHHSPNLLSMVAIVFITFPLYAMNSTLTQDHEELPIRERERQLSDAIRTSQKISQDPNSPPQRRQEALERKIAAEGKLEEVIKIIANEKKTLEEISRVLELVEKYLDQNNLDKAYAAQAKAFDLCNILAQNPYVPHSVKVSQEKKLNDSHVKLRQVEESCGRKSNVEKQNKIALNLLRGEFIELLNAN